MRLFVKVLIALSAPITLIAQGYFLNHMFYTAPWWVSVIVLAALVTVLLGFASLVDMRRQQGPR